MSRFLVRTGACHVGEHNGTFRLRLHLCSLKFESMANKIERVELLQNGPKTSFKSVISLSLLAGLVLLRARLSSYLTNQVLVIEKAPGVQVLGTATCEVKGGRWVVRGVCLCTHHKAQAKNFTPAVV